MLASSLWPEHSAVALSQQDTWGHPGPREFHTHGEVEVTLAQGVLLTQGSWGHLARKECAISLCH